MCTRTARLSPRQMQPQSNGMCFFCLFVSYDGHRVARRRGLRVGAWRSTALAVAVAVAVAAVAGRKSRTRGELRESEANEPKAKRFQLAKWWFRIWLTHTTALACERVCACECERVCVCVSVCVYTSLMLLFWFWRLAFFTVRRPSIYHFTMEF